MTVFAVQFNSPLLPPEGWIIGYLTEAEARANTLIIPGQGLTAFLFAAHVSDEDVMHSHAQTMLFQGQDVISSRNIDKWS